MLRELRCLTTDMIPGSLGAYKNMLLDLDAWIAVYGAEGDAMNCIPMDAAERSATLFAELKAPGFMCFVGGQEVMAFNPPK